MRRENRRAPNSASICTALLATALGEGCMAMIKTCKQSSTVPMPLICDFLVVDHREERLRLLYYNGTTQTVVVRFMEAPLLHVRQRLYHKAAGPINLLPTPFYPGLFSNAALLLMDERLHNLVHPPIQHPCKQTFIVWQDDI